MDGLCIWSCSNSMTLAFHRPKAATLAVAVHFMRSAWRRELRCVSEMACGCGWMRSAVWSWHHLVEDGFGGVWQLHLVEQFCETTLAGLPPAVDFGDDARQRESG